MGLWIDPETKQESSKNHHIHQDPKMLGQVDNNTKSILKYFFDVKGVIYKKFLAQAQTVNEERHLVKSNSPNTSSDILFTFITTMHQLNHL